MCKSNDNDENADNHIDKRKSNGQLQNKGQYESDIKQQGQFYRSTGVPVSVKSTRRVGQG